MFEVSMDFLFMCTARAVVISKWWLILNVLRFQSVLFPPLERNRGELKGNTRWPFLWHEPGNLFWKGHVCLDFMSITSKDWQEDMGAAGLPEAFAGKWSHIQRWVSAGDFWAHSLPMESITIKSLSLKLRGWFFQWIHHHSAQWPLSWAIVLLDIAGETIICWDSGRSVLVFFGYCGIWLKLGSVLLGYKLYVSVCCRECHHCLVLQLPLVRQNCGPQDLLATFVVQPFSLGVCLYWVPILSD